MEWLKKNLKKDRDGATLVSVIIGLTFLAAIGLIVIMASSQYLTAVFVDNNSKDNFYDAESILEEVRAGLVEETSEANKVVYKEIMEGYTDLRGDVKKEYAKRYIWYLANRLINPSVDISLDDFPNGTFKWEPDKYGRDGATGDWQEFTGSLQAIKKYAKTEVQDSVTTKEGELRFVIDNSVSDLYSLTLKNVMVDYVHDGYHSTITTDIRLKVPDLNFEGEGILEAARDYIVISDDKLAVKQGKGADFTGNVYTGIKGTDAEQEIENGDINTAGISIADHGVAAFNSAVMISRGNLGMEPGSNVTIDGLTGEPAELWLPNIALTKNMAIDDSTTFTMNADAHIENDLRIEDSNANVKLSGKYYGYSYNEENDGTVTGTKSKYSSAWLVNGYHTTIHAEGLDKLFLAGRTFVSKPDPSSGALQLSDIMMGESAAARSNQLAYLVPEEYMIGGMNPVVFGEDGEYTDKAQIAELKASDFGAYLDDSDPVTINVSPRSSGGYAYYFLKFKSDKAASDYFKALYKGELKDKKGNTIDMSDDLDSRALAYISTDDGEGMRLSANLYFLAGNIIHNYKEGGGSQRQSANYFSGSAPQPDVLKNGKLMGQEYVSRQRTLTADESVLSMRLGSTNATGEKYYATRLVEHNLVDFSKIPSTAEWSDAAAGGMIYAFDGDVNILNDGGTKNGIVIASGDVNVKGDFKGLIIAGGTVNIEESGLNLEHDPVMVKKLFDYAKGIPELADMFYDYNGAREQEPIRPKDCVSFRNWTRE